MTGAAVRRRIAVRAGFATAAVLTMAGCSDDAEPTRASPAAAGLSGEWQSGDYECPSGTRHSERVRITQNGTEISAVKITGDDCVPAGHETFKGTVTGTSGTVHFWLGRAGTKPFLSRDDVALRIEDDDTFTLDGPTDYTFTRVR